MSNISERLVVHCPYHEAPSYFASFFAKYQVGGGNRACIALHLPVRMFADRLLSLAQIVIATLYPVHSISDPNPRYLVSGRPMPATGSLNSAAGLPLQEVRVTIASTSSSTVTTK